MLSARLKPVLRTIICITITYGKQKYIYYTLAKLYNQMRGVTMFYPDKHYHRIYDIKFSDLKKNDIKGIIIDIDNTLVPWNSNNIEKNTHDWLLNALKEGFKLCFISNNTKSRVQSFNHTIDIPSLYNAKKPLRSAYKKASKIMGVALSNIAVIGDQVFTDVLGGNRLGLFTILVDPISEKEFIWTRLVRKIEKKYRNAKDEKNAGY